MSTKNHHLVLAENYSSDYTILGENSFSFQRVHHWPKASIELDVFPHYWSLAISNLDKGQLKIRSGEELIELSGLWAAFIPAFSVIEWHLAPGTFEFQAFLSKNPLPPLAPSYPCIFPLTETPPETISDISDLLSNHKNIQQIGKCIRPSTTAEMTKNYIDKNFEKNISISATAKELQQSHSVMTRTFTKCYGLSPVAYRNKLRIYSSVSMMLTKSQKVYSAGLGSGFSDISRFYSQFRKHINAQPSQFLINKTP